MVKVGRLVRVPCLVAICIALLAAGCQPAPSAGPGLTFSSLERALANGGPTVAEFGRGTCIPCKEMKPILEDLAAEYEGKVNVVIISVDDYRDLTRQYGIMAIPTQVFIGTDGQEVGRHVGFLPRADIVVQLRRMGVE